MSDVLLQIIKHYICGRQQDNAFKDTIKTDVTAKKAGSIVHQETWTSGVCEENYY